MAALSKRPCLTSRRQPAPSAPASHAARLSEVRSQVSGSAAARAIGFGRPDGNLAVFERAQDRGARRRQPQGRIEALQRAAELRHRHQRHRVRGADRHSPSRPELFAPHPQRGRRPARLRSSLPRPRSRSASPSDAALLRGCRPTSRWRGVSSRSAPRLDEPARSDARVFIEAGARPAVTSTRTPRINRGFGATVGVEPASCRAATCLPRILMRSSVASDD